MHATTCVARTGGLVLAVGLAVAVVSAPGTALADTSPGGAAGSSEPGRSADSGSSTSSSARTGRGSDATSSTSGATRTSPSSQRDSFDEGGGGASETDSASSSTSTDTPKITDGSGDSGPGESDASEAEPTPSAPEVSTPTETLPAPEVVETIPETGAEPDPQSLAPIDEVPSAAPPNSAPADTVPVEPEIADTRAGSSAATSASKESETQPATSNAIDSSSPVAADSAAEQMGDDVEAEPDASAAATPAPAEDTAGVAPVDSMPTEPATSTTSTTVVGTFVTGLLTVLGLAPNVASGPAVPVAPASNVFELAWALFRRIETLLFNKTPTARPVQLVQNSAGEVTGTVGGADADGDPLTYQVVAGPSRGTVAVNAQGTYTYTPSAAFAVTGGVDYFTVNVAEANAGSHIHGLTGLVSRVVRVLTLGLVRLPDGSTTTTNIKVSVASTVADSTTVGDRPAGVAISGDGTRAYVANSGSNTVSVIDTATGLVTATISVGRAPSGVAVGRDGTRVYVTNSEDDLVTVIDVATGTLIGAGISVGNSPTGIVISPDGSRAYVTNHGSALRAGDGTVSVIDLSTNTVVREIAVGDSPLGITVSPDGSRVFVANEASNSVSIIDAVTGEVTATVRVGIAPVAVITSPDGSRVYVANRGSSTMSDDGSISVIDAATATVIAKFATGEAPAGLAISADGGRLFIADRGFGLVTAIDPMTGVTVAGPIYVGSSPAGIAISPDGEFLFVSSDGPSVLDNSGIVSVIPTATLPLTSVGDDVLPGTVVLPVDTGVIVGVGAPVVEPIRGASGPTRRMGVINQTLNSMTLIGYVDSHRLFNGPGVGSVLAPGETHYFDINIINGITVRPLYQIPGGQQAQFPGGTSVQFPLQFMAVLAPQVSMSQVGCFSSGRYACDKPSRPGTSNLTEVGYVREGSTVAFLDPPGTQVTVRKPEDQAAILNAYCSDGKSGDCSYRANRETTYLTAKRRVPNTAPIVNNTTSPLTKTFTITDRKSQSSSFDVNFKLSFGLEKIVNVELSAKYSQTFTEERTYTDTVTVTVKPGEAVEINSQIPMRRVYGDFTVKIGNTTFRLPDTYFDNPDPTSPAVFTVDLFTPERSQAAA